MRAEARRLAEHGVTIGLRRSWSDACGLAPFQRPVGCGEPRESLAVTQVGDPSDTARGLALPPGCSQCIDALQ